MADTPFSTLPVANNTDTLEYAGLQDSITVQIPGSAALAQTLRDLGYTPAPINSPTFTGDPKAPTPTPGDNDTSIATTAFVVTSFAPIASPTFTGDPKAPTPATGDNDTSIATTAFVKAQNYVTALTAPVTSVFGRTGAVVATGGDYNVSEVTGAAPLANPVFTGDPQAPTPPPGDSDTSIATTAFVTNFAAPAVVGINHQAGPTYTLVLSDANTVVECDNNSPFVLTVPPNSGVAFPIGTPVYPMQFGGGQLTIAPGIGVTILNASSLIARAQNSFLGLVKLATNIWVLYGDMT